MGLREPLNGSLNPQPHPFVRSLWTRFWHLPTLGASPESLRASDFNGFRPYGFFVPITPPAPLKDEGFKLLIGHVS